MKDPQPSRNGSKKTNETPVQIKKPSDGITWVLTTFCYKNLPPFINLSINPFSAHVCLLWS